jgi:hypothetical protein
MPRYRIAQIEDYEPLIGSENVERIREKARRLKGLRVANFNSTYYGGGVAETRTPENCVHCSRKWLTRYLEQCLNFFDTFDKNFSLQE